MVNLKTLLEQLLSEDVDEAAVAVAQARSEQLAVAINKKHELCLTLYRPWEVLKNMNELTAGRKERIGADSVLYEAFDVDVIVGSMTIRRTKGTNEVISSAAEKGYGPLLYDIGLSLMYPEALMSDRGSVSGTARKVWDYYFRNRKDVNKIFMKSKLGKVIMAPSPTDRQQAKDVNSFLDFYDQIGALEDHIKYNSNNKEGAKLATELAGKNVELKSRLVKYNETMAKNPLAYSYQIKSPKSFVSLTNNHLKLVSTLKAKFNIPRSGIENELMDTAGAYFSNKYLIGSL